MDNKDKPQAKIKGGDKENKTDSLLKARINGFLINYFNYITFILAIIIFAAGLLLFVYPNYQKITQANRAAKENLLIEYDKNLDYLSKIRNLKKSYELIDPEDVSKIDAMVPSGSDISGIISEIELIAVGNGTILNSVKVSPEEAGEEIKANTEAGEKTEPPAGIFYKLPQGVSRAKIEVRLGAVNYEVFKNIIKTFENNIRLFDVLKIEFDSAENKASLAVYTYYIQ